VITRILASGFGGQGVVLSGMVLGQAGVLEGLYVAQAASYGAEARGSACKCGIILSDQPIAYPHVTEVDWLLAMSQDGYDKFLPLVTDAGKIVLEQGLVEPNTDDSRAHIAIPATTTALKEFKHRMGANMIFLAASVSLGGFVSRKSLEEALRISVPQQHHNLNLRAFELGFRIAKNMEIGS
jgi:2-oxoglutarate ferredoxin oxidoreductase subunit gamma